MRNLYTLLLALLFLTHHSQLTLLRQWHEPVAGEQTGVRAYDSTATIPKASGSGQTWDFSSMVLNPMAATASHFVLPSTVPASSLYPEATVVESKGNETTFFKSTASPDKFEGLGYQSPGASVNYSTDPMTVFSWPISLGTSYSDNFSGTISGMFNGSITGTLSTTASGAGTLILPGSDRYTNVLQLTSVQSATLPNNSAVATNISYSYFHTSQKFPLVTVNYFRMINTAPPNLTYSVFVNKLLAVGINDQVFQPGFTLYPNPASGAIHVKLTNPGGESCHVSVLGMEGQLLKHAELGHETSIEAEVSVSGLPKGLYIVRTELGNSRALRKLSIQ